MKNSAPNHNHIKNLKSLCPHSPSRISHPPSHIPHLTSPTPHPLLLLLFTLLLFQLLSLPAAAQTPDADVDFYLVPPEDNQPYTVGDHIVLRLEVKHPAGSRVELPQLADEQWGTLDVIDQTAPETAANGDGSVTTGKNIIVSAYEPGQYQTEALVVTHQKADGSVEELGTPVIPFTIESVLVEGDAELRDLKAQAILPVPPIWPLILAGLLGAILLAGVLAGAGLWWYHHKKSRQVFAPIPLTPMVDPRPPEVVALAELDRIESLNLPANSQFKEHYSLVTNCLRRYIEGRYYIPALEQTTSEIRAAFDKSTTPKEAVREFTKMFMDGDLVKFARFRPHPQEAYVIVDEARTLVNTTTPQPEEITLDDEPAPEPEVIT